MRAPDTKSPPSKRMSKQDRVEARRRFLAEQERRKRIEAYIAELEKQPGGVSDAQLDKLGLVVQQPSPALAFMMKRLNAVSLDDPQFDDKCLAIIDDLIESDVQLDPRTRSLVAGEFRRLANPARYRRRKRQLEVAWIELEKRWLLSTGMMAAEAEQVIAKERGITVAALRKRISRTKT